MVMSMKGDEILGRYIKVSLESMASGFSLLWGDVMYLHRHKDWTQMPGRFMWKRVSENEEAYRYHTSKLKAQHVASGLWPC